MYVFRLHPQLAGIIANPSSKEGTYNSFYGMDILRIDAPAFIRKQLGTDPNICIRYIFLYPHLRLLDSGFHLSICFKVEGFIFSLS